MGPQEYLLFLEGEYYIIKQLNILPKNNLNPISQILEFIILYWQKSLFMIDTEFFKVGQLPCIKN